MKKRVLNEKFVDAAYAGNLKAMRQLLRMGANVNGCDSKDKTALMKAKTDSVTKFLLKNGADPNLKGYGGYTPLMIAESDAQVDILLGAGADPNIQNNDGWSALMFFSNSGRKKAVKNLLEHKADPNLRSSPPANTSAFLEAIEQGHLEILKLLIKAGVNPVNEEIELFSQTCGDTFLDMVKTPRMRKFIKSLDLPNLPVDEMDVS